MSSPNGPRRPESSRERIIVALDLPTVEQAMDMVDTLGNEVLWYKVGMELFYSGGPGILGRLRELGKEIFLDLKLHDIPNTMANGLRSLARHEVGLTTVHIAAGGAALREVVSASREIEAKGGRAPAVLGVTRLTSLPAPDPERPLDDIVSLAGEAVASEISGWIAPASAAPKLRETYGRGPVLVCPGIRLPDGDQADQVSVSTPEAATHGGADWIVVGRPITQAADPKGVAREIAARLG